MLALAALIAFSRVYLGVHFWIDVLAGAALGLAVGLCVAWPLRGSGRRDRPDLGGDGVALEGRPGG